MPGIKAVLFDLDDTLFDHRYCTRTALSHLQDKYECFRRATLDEFETEHMKLLDELMNAVLPGTLSIEEARTERFRRAFVKFNAKAEAGESKIAAGIYRKMYEESWRLSSGALPFLKSLNKKYKIGIITNNLRSEQEEKLKRCGIEHFIDVMVTSEDTGLTKPSAEMFKITLGKLGVLPEETVMIGDSWTADITGAYNAGIKSIWLNIYGIDCPDPSMAYEIRSLNELNDFENILNLL